MADVLGSLVIADDGVAIAKWEGITENDAGKMIRMAAFPVKTVHVTGDFGGGDVTLEGSNDGSNFETLLDCSGSPVTVNSAGIFRLQANPLYIQVTVATGTAMDIDVIIVGAQR